MIAFIADRLSAAQADIRHDYNLVKTTGSNRGIVEIDGREVPFVIVTYPDQLRGLELESYTFLPSSIRLKSMARDEMELIAKSRVRPAPFEAKP